MYISVIPICGVAFETFKIGSSGTGRNPNLRRFIPLEKDQCWNSALFCVSEPEIVLDCNDYPEALDWVRKLLGCATATGRSKPLLVSASVCVLDTAAPASVVCRKSRLVGIHIM